LKRICLATLTSLWALSIAIPPAWLQAWKVHVAGLVIPGYYLAFSLPTLGVGIYALAIERPKSFWLRAWWGWPLLLVPGCLLAANRGWAIRQWLSFVLRGIVAGGSFAYLLHDFRHRRNVLTIVYGVAILAALVGLVEMRTQSNILTDQILNRPVLEQPGSGNSLYAPPAYNSESSRPRGTQGNRIAYIACLVPFLPFALWGFLRHSGKAVWLNLIAFCILAAIVIWSGSRSGLVGALCAVSVYALLAGRANRPLARRIVLVLVATVAISAAVPAIRVSFENRLSDWTAANQDIQHRLGALPTIRALRDHFIFGLGYGNYPIAHQLYYRGPFRFLEVPDNQYLRWLVENGALGGTALLLYLAGLIAALLRKWKSAPQDARLFDAAVISGWIGVAVTFLFFDGFYWIGPNMTFWGFLAIAGSTLQNPPRN
jgi:hypothetical protein